MVILRTLFHWPDGIVVGNLIASALWAAPAFAHLHCKLRRHHAELLASHKDLHDKVDAINGKT